MKKNILLTALAVGLLIVPTACEDNRDEFLSDFSTILYFRNSGEIALTTYITDENANYTLIVNKSGSDLGAVSSVDVNIMSKASLQAYNTEYGYDYQAFPASCYKFERTTLEFGSADLYKEVPVELITTAINASTGTDGVYVIPFELTNGTDSINSEKRYVFLQVTAQYPNIVFEQSGFSSTTLNDDGSATAELAYNLTIPVGNSGGLQCDLIVDPTLLDAYNQENGTSYELLNAANYTMDNSISFGEGATSATFKITVNKENLEYGDYMIPVRIANPSSPNFQVDEGTGVALIGITYTLPEIALTADMLSSNHVEPSEGSLANLLDGNVASYFHSTWSETTTDEHYLQVDLNEPISTLSFTYTTRNSNGNAAPAELYVSVSADGERWTEVERFTNAADGLPTGGAMSWTSPRIDCDESISHVRFTNVVNATGSAYFVWSEFSMCGK